MMNHIAATCCLSSVPTATTKLSLAADKVAGRDSDLGQVLKKKKILNWLAVGERTERLLKVRALQKMLGSTSKESLLLFHHASSLGR